MIFAPLRASWLHPTGTSCISFCNGSLPGQSWACGVVHRLAWSVAAAYSQWTVTKAFVNAEETICRVVGKRTQAPAALSATTSRKSDSVAWQRSFGGVRVPRGVHRFKTHAEAERWLWRMITRPTS